ncbi:semaphorin-4F [Alligator mississippiensis]|uniref:semaphorin-4F n=1 Tax=Alligator mississippiensis TaxID=8496 RepID=UPI00287758FA|nr:semaphorin-4F [Alligator mississippiensis]
MGMGLGMGLGPGSGLRLRLLLLALLAPPPAPRAAATTTATALPRTARPFPEVQEIVRRFSHTTVSNYSILLVAPQLRTLYVGAKDAIFALSLDSIDQHAKMIEWKVPEHQRLSCTMKGKKEAECHNYIRILDFASESHLFVCGTYAFDPQCGFINVASFSGVEHQDTGRGKCPFEPMQRSAAVMADGVLYAATVNNFLGTEPIISRATGTSEERIRTETSVTWLNDPNFVGSTFLRESESGEDDKIYFFFTETAREYDFYEKVKVPRVARVCKGDLGGLKTLQKRWTTFLKTQLICSDPKTRTNFNLLKDVFTLRSDNWTSTIFYGLFSAHRDGGEVSAVCAYSIRDVQKSMSGRFKEFKRDCEKWTSVIASDVPEPRPGTCITNSMKLAGFGSSLTLPDRVLTFVRDHPLMDQPVRPLEHAPLVVQRGAPYHRVAVHRVRSLTGTDYDVLFLGTEDGHLHKAVKIGPTAAIIEDLTLFPEPRPVQNLQLHQSWLYVGSSTDVIQVNTTACEQYGSCHDCILSRDPACAWSRELGACVVHQGQSELLQDITSANISGLCPKEMEAGPVMAEVPVSLGARVVLPCAPPSAWSVCTWQRPSPDAHAYTERRDGLEFTVTAAMLGDYVCQCTEGGVGATAASYSLVWGSGTTSAWQETRRSYSIVTGLVCFLLGLVLGCVGCFFLDWRRRERQQRELINREKNGLDLMQSNTTSCSHEPHTPSSPEDERHPLATTKNGNLNGFPPLYISELDKDQARIFLAGAPLAKCDETSI